MNKVYDIETTTMSSQTHSVVAENIGQAERLFLAEYPTATIKSVILHSEYVLTVGTPASVDIPNPKPDTCKWKDEGDTVVFIPDGSESCLKCCFKFMSSACVQNECHGDNRADGKTGHYEAETIEQEGQPNE